MSRFEMILLCLCLGACTSTPLSGLDDMTRMSLIAQGYEVIDTPEQFNARVVGHKLSGSGYRVQVEPGGILTGQYVGEVFQGVWVFENGQYCRSLTPELGGPTYGCFWVAANHDDIRLIPVTTEQGGGS